MKWPTARLGDVAAFIRGINFKPDDVMPLGTEGTVACMRTKNVQTELDVSDVWAVADTFVRRGEQYLTEGDLLVSSANSWNLVGKCSWIPKLPWRATFGGFVSVLRPDASKLEPRFLFHWFASDRVQATLRSFGQQTTNISNLNTERTLNLAIPFPPVAEQKRIAGILDQADALRALRRTAIAKLDALPQAIFADMFGDPVTSFARYPKRPLGELCQLDSQLVDPTLPEYESLLHFGPDRIESGTGRLLPANTAAQDALTSVKFYFDSDCILYSKIRPNLNKVALATGPALCSADVYPLTVRPHAATREFLCQLLLSDDFLTYAASLSNRANIPKLNKEQVLAYPALVPPLALQEEFARRVGAVEQLRSAHRDALTKLDELFAALQHRAFRGEL